MRNTKIVIQGVMLLLTLISCEIQQQLEYPVVYTGDVTNITDTSALFTAKTSYSGEDPVLEFGFIWSVRSNDNNGIKIKSSEYFSNIFSFNTNEKLTPGITYYVRGYVQTEKAISYGREVSFESTNRQDYSGKWSQIYNDSFVLGSCESVLTSFTINSIVYLAIDGELFSYNPETNAFNYELSNEMLFDASYSAVYNENAYIFSKNSFYKFDPQTKSFTKLLILNENDILTGASCFIIADNIYVGLGISSATENYLSDFWKYNITTDSWEQIAPFAGEYRYSGFSFSINNRGFVGGGIRDRRTNLNDLWCYTPEFDKWEKKESFTFQYYDLSILLSTNTESLGYCNYQNMFYEYNPIFDNWEKMTGLEYSYNACRPTMFAVGKKVFILYVKNHMDTKQYQMWSYEK